MADEDATTPDKVEYALVIQCANPEQVREAMRTGKVEFTIFDHYEPNEAPTRPAQPGKMP